MQATTIGLDVAKHNFQVHDVAARGQVVLRRQPGLLLIDLSAMFSVRREAMLLPLQLARGLQDDLRLASVKTHPASNLHRSAGYSGRVRKLSRILRKDHRGKRIFRVTSSHVDEGHP